MQTTGGATPLMYACQQCREHEVLDILRKQPYSVKDRDRTLKTPLHYCAENSSTSCAEAILKIAPELVNAQDENGYCPLHLAVIAGNKPLIRLLITKGADINIYDNEGHSAVHWAIVSSEKEALEMIIRAGANPSTPDVHGGYPLHYAVQMCGSNCDYIRNFEDTVKVVETLLSFGVNVNVKDKDGRQPILWAASAGSADAIVHLISGGACVEAADKDGLTALHCAASRGHTTTLETLITLCGANVDVIDGNGCSALFYAVTLGHADATELLLKLGAEPNRQDRKGRTPAHCGAAKGQLETLRILKKHGGNLWLRNVRGDIPLHEAVASGRKDLVLWLLSQNPEAINVANNDGRCLIHIASMYNNTDMVKVLLDAKSLVNPVMRTSKGILMTPLNVALCKGHRSCGKFLQLHGGVPFSKVSKVETNAIYAVRISPSDDMMNKSGEATIESITPSYSKVSTNKSSGDSNILKVESADKKKVYRRRKKRKTNSNVDRRDSDSDSDDSYYELKAKATEIRMNGRINNNYDEDESNKVYVESKKERDGDGSLVQRSGKESPTGKKVEIQEEAIAAKRATKIKTDSKTLQRNKSFSETKNVSDLSPEDFPPMMQSIKRLDTEMMEAEIEISKPLGEGEVETLKIPHLEISTSGDSEAAQREEKEEKGDLSAKEKSGDDVKTTPSFRVIETDENEKSGGGKDVVSEESGSVESGKTEKSAKTVAKRSNGGGKKESTRSAGSSGSKSSNEESFARRSEKHGRSSNSRTSSDGSSVRKDEKSTKSGAKNHGDGAFNGSEKSKKSSSSSKSSKSGGSSVKKDDKFLKVPGKKISNVEASPDGGDEPKIEPTSAEASAGEEKIKKEPEILITDDAVVVESEQTTNASGAVLLDGVSQGNEKIESGAEAKTHLNGASGGGDEASVQDSEETVKEPVKNSEESVKESVKDSEESVKETVKDSEESVKESVKDSKESVKETVKDSEEFVKESIKDSEESVKISEPETETVEAEVKAVGIQENEQQPEIPEQKSVGPEILVEGAPANLSQDPETVEPESLPPETEVASELLEIKEENSPIEKGEDSIEPAVEGSREKLEGDGGGVENVSEAKSAESDEILVENSSETLDTKELLEATQKEETPVPSAEPEVLLRSVEEHFIETKEAPPVFLDGSPKTRMNSPEKDKENESKSEAAITSAPSSPAIADEEVSGTVEDPSVELNQNEEEESEDKIKEGNDNSENSVVELNDGERSDKETKTLKVNSSKVEEESAEGNSPLEPSSDPHTKETNEWMAGGQRHYKAPRVSRLCRRHREFRDEVNDVSVTQLVQNTIRKYHMERGIFYQLLELKRLQIRAGRANEQVLVKRLADEYERSRAFVGMKHFSGLYKFREFEKFLYDQLKSLNSRHTLAIPEMKSYDDIDALSGILKKSRYKIISEIPESERICTCITQRCHHSACAYTSVPCSAYVTNYHRHKSHRPKKECFFPRIEQSPNFKSDRQNVDESPATLELIQGNQKRVITLPQAFPDKSKRYYVTFTIKGSPSFKEEEFFQDPKEFFKHRHAKSV